MVKLLRFLYVTDVTYSVTQVVYSCIQQEFVNRADKFHIVLVSFEVTINVYSHTVQDALQCALPRLSHPLLPTSLSELPRWSKIRVLLQHVGDAYQFHWAGCVSHRMWQHMPI